MNRSVHTEHDLDCAVELVQDWRRPPNMWELGRRIADIHAASCGCCGSFDFQRAMMGA